MNSRLFILFSIIVFSTVLSCQSSNNNGQNEGDKHLYESEADSIIALAQIAHGVAAFDSLGFEFIFRNKKYTFDFKNSMFTRSDSADWRYIKDFYQGDNFYREINGERESLTDSDQSKYASSVNSVIYFATLPYKLTDESVISYDMGQQIIKSNTYNGVKVEFKEKGGGEDHQDVFYYWFNSKTHLIDYFAYQYETNGGGIRFREAIKQTKVGGSVFQDYVNYEVAVGTRLHEIPALFEMDSLKELSRIENKYIRIID
ncbi:MAG: DUF6503 family protein [Crocinitomicaceae bacterium]